MRRFLKVQPLFTMQQSHQQVIVMLEPAFCSGHNRVISLLCDMLRSIYKPFPVPSATQPAELPKEVHVSSPRTLSFLFHLACALSACRMTGVPLILSADLRPPTGLLCAAER